MTFGPSNEIALGQFRSHPLAFWFSIGVFLSGAIAVLFPGTADDSAATLALSPGIRTAFNLLWVIGGFLAAYGAYRGKKAHEAAGMSLISTSLLAWVATIISIRPDSAPTTTFIVCVAIGCWLRSRFLTGVRYS